MIGHLARWFRNGALATVCAVVVITIAADRPRTGKHRSAR